MSSFIRKEFMLTFTKANNLKIFKGYVITKKEEIDKMHDFILERLEDDGVTEKALNELFMWGETEKTTNDKITEGAFINMVENAIFNSLVTTTNTKSI